MASAGSASPAPTDATSSGVSGLNAGGVAGLAGGVAGIYSGINSGKPQGYASAGVGAAQLAATKTNAFGANSGTVNNYAGGASNVLGIYSGLKQGGVSGYGGAAVNAVQLGSRVGAFGGYSGAAGTAAGYVAAPLAVYNAVKNYKSGATGSDTLNGAEAGAAIGSIVPGIGTVVGGLVGGAVGAISSAFGNGEVDPENSNFNSYTQQFNKAPAAQQGQVAAAVQNPYLPLAGYFDLRANQLKGQNPIYTTYGRAGEQKFTNDLIGKISQAKSSGVTDPSKVFNSVVQPWLNSMGTWNDSNKAAMTALIQNMTGQIVSGSYQQNFKAVGGDSPFKNLTGS